MRGQTSSATLKQREPCTHRSPFAIPNASSPGSAAGSPWPTAPLGCTRSLTARRGETVGFVGFVPRELDWGNEIELGWLVRRAFWGRSYATEAARALRPLVPGRVISMIRVDNEASAKVACKLAMSLEREVDYHGFRTNVWVSLAAD